MELSAAQMQAIENGEAVAITVGHTQCVLLREDLYQRVKALLDLEATYPLLDEAFREGWEAPGMADYAEDDMIFLCVSIQSSCSRHGGPWRDHGFIYYVG